MVKPVYKKTAHKLTCMLLLAVIVDLLCTTNVIHTSFAYAAFSFMLIGRAIIMGLDRLDVLNQNTDLKLTDKAANILLVGITVVLGLVIFAVIYCNTGNRFKK